MARNGIFFALEEEDLVGVGAAEVVPEVQAEVEAGVAETSVDSGEIGDMTAAIEEAAEGADQIEAIQEVAEQSVEAGEGLPPEAAQVAEIAVEGICARLGMRPKQVVPATESFGSKNSRLAATKIAIESIGERIKTIWEAIVKAIKAVYNKVKDFFAKFFANAERVGKLAKELKAKVEAMASTAKAEGEIENSGIAKSLSDGSKTDISTATKVLEMHLAFANSFKAGINAFSSVSSAIYHNATKLSAEKTADKASGNIQAELKKLEAAFSGGDTVEAKAEGVEADFARKTKPLVNGDALQLVIGKKANRPYVALTVEQGDSKVEKAAVLTKDNMKALCDSVVVAMDAVSKVQKDLSSVEKVNKELQNTAEAMLKMAGTVGKETGDSEGVKKAIEDVRAVVIGMNSATTTFSTFVPLSGVRAGKAACAYVSASMKKYAEPKEEKKDEKKD